MFQQCGFSDDQDATSVFYDNTSSNLSATDVQAAIDEVNQNRRFRGHEHQHL